MERIKLEALCKYGLTTISVGEQLDRDRTTIEREIAKGQVEQITTNLVQYEI